MTHEFAVRITLADRSKGLHRGWYACGIDAVLRAMHWFPQAKSISAMRIQPAATTQHNVYAIHLSTATSNVTTEAQP